MSITVEAIYESGVLKPLEPLDNLREHERVRVVEPVSLVAEQRQERIKLDPMIALDIAESPEEEARAKISRKFPASDNEGLGKSYGL